MMTLHPFKDGVINSDNNIAGTYLHGVFDSPELLNYWLNWAGLNEIDTFDYPGFRSQQIDRLADAVEEAFPLEKLLSLMTPEGSSTK